MPILLAAGGFTCYNAAGGHHLMDTPPAGLADCHRHIVFGSDAHKPEHVGHAYPALAAAAWTAGYILRFYV
jgi:hypothetical protein